MEQVRIVRAVGVRRSVGRAVVGGGSDNDGHILRFFSGVVNRLCAAPVIHRVVPCAAVAGIEVLIQRRNGRRVNFRNERGVGGKAGDLRGLVVEGACGESRTAVAVHVDLVDLEHMGIRCFGVHLFAVGGLPSDLGIVLGLGRGSGHIAEQSVFRIAGYAGRCGQCPELRIGQYRVKGVQIDLVVLNRRAFGKSRDDRGDFLDRAGIGLQGSGP